MKSISYLVLFVFALAITVTSCKKDKLTPKEMLTAKSWKLSSSKVNGVETIEDCSKDDILIFAVNGTYSMTVGSILCYDGDTNYTGSWTLSADGKTITVDGEPTPIIITESKLVVTTVDGTQTTVITLIPV